MNKLSDLPSQVQVYGLRWSFINDGSLPDIYWIYSSPVQEGKIMSDRLVDRSFIADFERLRAQPKPIMARLASQEDGCQVELFLLRQSPPPIKRWFYQPTRQLLTGQIFFIGSSDQPAEGYQVLAAQDEQGYLAVRSLIGSKRYVFQFSSQAQVLSLFRYY